jgi:two-component system phosphate regulon sensor histidine kinase PhoR
VKRKIYYNLALIATIATIITSIVLAFISFYFYDLKIIKTLPALIGSIIFILILLYILSYYLASKIIEPMEKAYQSTQNIESGEELSEENIYEELRPFIKTIAIQKKDIEFAHQRIKEAEKTRSEFTANVSHELKTPLTSINGFAEMIASGMAKDEEIVKFANIIHKEGSRLLDLIDSIINLSHLDEKTFEANFESLDIYEITEKIVSQLRFRAMEKNITLNLSGQHLTFRGNRRMIEDLIFNLLDNGIKYNKENGKVDISIDKSNDYLSFSIKDTGIGIPKADQNRVFERFYRVDKSRSKRIQGSGLGLSIVKHIVEFHNGIINLISEENKGTEIEILFPI